MNIIKRIEDYLSDYIAFADSIYSLPVALWIISTHIFESFDAFPYLAITSATKQSGKTRLAELCSFACHDPLFTTGATAPSIFYRYDISERDRKNGKKAPTLFMDEAEKLSSSTDMNMRAFLNGGYRKGITITRVGRDFPCYSPKAFILIGDVYDTLRDRSIIVTMRRGEPKRRFLRSAVESVGGEIRAAILVELKNSLQSIEKAYREHPGMGFLPDRDEEIWLALSSVARVLCPDRIEELNRSANDIATEKTAPRRRYVDLAGEEDKALNEQFAKRLLLDMHDSFNGKRTISTADIVAKLTALPTAPWRRFRGEGLTSHNISDMLSIYGISPRVIQLGSRTNNTRQLARGYRLADIAKAIESHGIKRDGQQ